MGLILASESARRVELLSGAGYDFEAVKSGFPEVALEDPGATAERNARGKALAVAAECPEDVILGADTVVSLPQEGSVFGKAGDEGEVAAMLGALQGRVHEVHTGVAVVRDGGVRVSRSVTEVRMRSLSREEISAYTALGEGIGKAGGYAIQGKAALLVEWISGDYTNVVGLPLALTCRMLEEAGIPWY